MSNYDLLGNIAIMKFPRNVKSAEKKKFALKLLKLHKQVRTVLEKKDKFSGRLRTQKTSFIAGEHAKEVLYRENNCLFRFNVDTCYFSPRLSAERKEIASKVKKGERVLVMFGGVGVYAIVIGKLSRAKNIISVELSRACSKYALENVKKNKLSNVQIIQGDVRKKVKGKFDRVVMPRPNLKDSFLDVAFRAVKSKGIIHYYGFTGKKSFPVPKTPKTKKGVSGYSEDEKNKMLEMILLEARKARRKIKILEVKKAGEVGVRKFRYRVDLRVL